MVGEDLLLNGDPSFFLQVFDNFVVFIADGLYLCHDALAGVVLPQNFELISQFSNGHVQIFNLGLQQVNFLDAHLQLIE